MRTHQELYAHLIDTGVIRRSEIARAFARVDRADFVLPGTPDDSAYADHALSIHYGQTISQPSTVALMLELLAPHEGQTILDVGSGSGWTSALLGDVVGQSGYVYGVEIIPELVLYGRKNVQKYHKDTVTITQATHGIIGDPGHAPFDRILVSAAGHDIPRSLIEQLKINGILVLPVDHDIVRVYKTADDDYDMTRYNGFVFVPLVV